MPHPQEISQATPEITLNLRDSMLQLAHDICAAEIVIPELRPRTITEEWREIKLTDPAIFATPLILPLIKVERANATEFTIVKANFTLADEDTTVSVTPNDEPLDGDIFLRYVYDKFRRTYDEHPHDQCTPFKDVLRSTHRHRLDSTLFETIW